MSRCMHPLGEIVSRTVSEHGLTITTSMGINSKAKLEYTCLACGKTWTRMPKKLEQANALGGWDYGGGLDDPRY